MRSAAFHFAFRQERLEHLLVHKGVFVAKERIKNNLYGLVLVVLATAKFKLRIYIRLETVVQLLAFRSQYSQQRVERAELFEFLRPRKFHFVDDVLSDE